MELNQVNAILVALSLCAAWIVAWKLARQNITSLFRYRIWKLRDEIVDEMLAGSITTQPAFDKFISLAERMIIAADHLTLLSWLSIPTSRGETCEWHLRELPASEKAKFMEYFQRMDAALNFHLVFNSALGRLLLVVVFPVFSVLTVMVAVYRGTWKAATPFWQERLNGVAGFFLRTDEKVWNFETDHSTDSLSNCVG